jgi:hypothetical protein
VIAAVVVPLLALASWLVIRADPGGRPESRAPATTAPAAPASGAAVPGASAPGAPVPGGSASGGPGSSTAPAGPPGDAVATPASTRAERPPLPDGWINYRDRTGFSVYVPEGWRRTREGSMVYFRDSRTGRVLGIDQTTRPAPDPVADWRGKADYRVSRGDFPGYDEIRIAPVRYWRKAADWEFTFNGSSARQHVNNRGFVVSDRQAYGIWWQTRHADWAAARDDLRLVFDSFRPRS